MYYLTKGLHLRELKYKTFTIEDIFGNSTLPFYCAYDEIDEKVKKIANVRKLFPTAEASELSSFTSFSWNQLEYYYVAHIEYAAKRYLMNQDEVDSYHSSEFLVPIAYLDCGRGDGTKKTLEIIDKMVRSEFKNTKSPFSEIFLNRWLILQEISRICSDILSTIMRAINALIDLLNIHRYCIKNNSGDLELLGCSEIIHSGKISYSASTAATTAAISLCTSLDLSIKLINYVDSISVDETNYKPASGKHFSDFKKIKLKSFPSESIEQISDILNEIDDLGAIIQFRNDIIHSTSAIELEKIYIGKNTAEINNLPLHYSFQSWRDCNENGQPIRYLGRSYFTENSEEIESKIHSWLLSIISAHIEIGKTVHDFLRSKPAK